MGETRGTDLSGDSVRCYRNEGGLRRRSQGFSRIQRRMAVGEGAPCRRT
jgi:hypothetical protein